MVWDIMTNGRSVRKNLYLFGDLIISHCHLRTYKVHDAIFNGDIGTDNVGHDLTPREIARSAVCARFHLEACIKSEEKGYCMPAMVTLPANVRV